MTLTKFAQNSYCGEVLARAVVRQVGGWDAFKEDADTVNCYGASNGVSGFIYYNDTVKFYKDHKAEIYSLIHNQMQEFGMKSTIEFVANFNCLKDVSEDEIGITLYGQGNKIDTNVANALAWYALEEVCRDYCNQ